MNVQVGSTLRSGTQPEERPYGIVEKLAPSFNHAHATLLWLHEHEVHICGRKMQSAFERIDVSKVTGETVAYRGAYAYDPLSLRIERRSWRFKVKHGRVVIDDTFPIKMFI